MRNIFKIFGRDVKAISRHFFAFVVAIAIMILPSLYAWLNIYANWDPYGNTGNISIAVASMDKGYVTDSGEKVNKGDDIIADLRESTAIDWVITDSEEEAVNGVYSGDYYAAIVIDENFSYSMYNMLTEWNGKPEITYYENAKKNAVATKITDTAAESLKRSINENYLEVLISGIMEQANLIADEIAEDNPREALHIVLQQALTTLKAAQHALDKFGAGDTGNITIDSSVLDGIIADLNSKLPEGDKIRDNVAEMDIAIYEALEKVQASLDRLQDAVNSGNAEAIESAKKAVEKAAADAIAMGNKVSDWGNSLPGDNIAVSEAKALAQQIANNFYDLGKWLNALPHRDDIQQAVGDCQDIVDTIFGLTDNFVPGAEELTKAVEDIFLNVAATLDSVRKLNNDALLLRDAVESTKTALDDTLHALQPTASRVVASLTETLQKLDNITTDEDYFAALVDLLGGSPVVYGQYLAQIVQTSITPVYPIENYGSAMTPFYSVLAVWVGGVILSVIIKPHADTEGLVKPKPVQLFFGRYLLYFVINQIQTAIIIAGDLLILKIQCLHPGLLFLAGAVTSLTFSLLIYSLAVSFGDVGKAIVVVIMVLQIAGSSGTFPIELLPHVYQKIYLFFPFPYAIDAMRECICGLYGNIFVTKLAQLLIFALAALIIGLFVRKPFVGINHFMEERLEETGLF